MHLEKKALAALTVGSLCIAFAPILVRLSEVEPVSTAAYRMLLALPFYLVWMLMDRFSGQFVGLDKQADEGRVLRLKRIFSEQRGLIVFAGVCFAGDLALWHWSIKLTSVANATLMANLAPVFVIVLAAVFWREKFKLAYLGSVFIAILGAVLLIYDGAKGHSSALSGDLLGVLTALCYAGYLMALAKLRLKYGTFEVMLSTTILSCVLLTGLALALEVQWFPQSAKGWWVLFALALLPQCVGQGLIAYGLAHLSASYSSINLLLQPVAATLLAWVLFNETLQMLQMIGAVIVMMAIMLCHMTRADYKKV